MMKIKDDVVFKRAIEILRARIGIVSNKKALLDFEGGLVFDICEDSERAKLARLADLRTDFHEVKKIRFSPNLDARLYIVDKKCPPKIRISSHTIVAEGEFNLLKENAEDLRFSFLGNEGLLYRYVLRVLEEKYDMLNFHACGMYRKRDNRLFIGCGGKGSGKSCLILKGLEEGLKLFYAEMIHCEVPIRKQSSDSSITFYKGALLDNVRVGNLKYSFPTILGKLNIKLPDVQDEWGTKIPVDMSSFQTPFDRITDPRITLIFPKIEEDRRKTIITEMKHKQSIKKALFENISEKIGETFLLYESVPVPGLDTTSLAKDRLRKIDSLLKWGKIDKVLKVISRPQKCWEGIL